MDAAKWFIMPERVPCKVRAVRILRSRSRGASGRGTRITPTPPRRARSRGSRPGTRSRRANAGDRVELDATEAPDGEDKGEIRVNVGDAFHDAAPVAVERSRGHDAPVPSVYHPWRRTKRLRSESPRSKFLATQTTSHLWATLRAHEGSLRMLWPLSCTEVDVVTLVRSTNVLAKASPSPRRGCPSCRPRSA
jgi:hypothetical protein